MTAVEIATYIIIFISIIALIKVLSLIFHVNSTLDNTDKSNKSVDVSMTNMSLSSSIRDIKSSDLDKGERSEGDVGGVI